MPNIRALTRSFAGGEVTPEFYGRIDDVKYQTGAAKLRNFIALPHGPAANRPGFAFVRAVKTSTKRTRIIPFSYSTTQTMVLEFGESYIRFHTEGATLLAGSPAAYDNATAYVLGNLVSSAGVNYYCIAATTGNAPPNATYWYALPSAAYEIPTPYLEADLFDIHYVQSADVLTLVHPSYAPRELRRLGATSWTLAAVSFVPDLAVPATVSATPTVGKTLSITAITQASPGLLTTASNHGLVAGNSVYVSGVGGMVELTTGFYVVNTAPGTNTITLKTVGGGVPVDTTAYTAYTSGGVLQDIPYSGDTSQGYKVTAVDATGLQESLPSSAATCTNNLLVTGNFNTIAWSVVSGAARYNVYKESSGLYGYIGQADGTSFVDDNITADFGKTPPNSSNPFSGAGNYPGAVSYFEQRRCFAGTTNRPQNIWMTRSGTESNLSNSIPTRDDDAITFRVAAREANTIRHIVPLGDLVLLTGSAEWRVTSVNSDAITPTSISVRPQSYVGSNNVQPVIVNNNLIYAASRGGHVREMAYSDQVNGFVTGDLSLRAPHLFDSLTIVDMALAKAPQPIIWFVSSDGRLLGLTYVPEQQVGAWHQHDTDGSFESIAVVAEGNEDALYAVVKRTINGSDVRYVERMASRLFTDAEDAFFVDAGATYSGAPADTITGLAHLEGKTVSILADAAVHPQLVVTGGQITLDVEASTVQVGLPIEADLQTLPLAIQAEAFGQGRVKNVNKAWLRVYRSSGIFVGPSADKLVEVKQRTTEPYGSPPDLKSEELPVMLTPTWADSGQVFIRQSDPLPFTLVSLTLEVSVGG